MARARREASLRIVAGPEWVAVANQLREVDRRLPTWLRKELRKAVKPAVQEVKRDIRNLPVRHRGHTGLRREIARGVGVQAKVSARRSSLRIVTRMPPGKEIIPRGFTRHEGWRHPLFGGSEDVQQHPLAEWHFADDIASHRDEIADNMRNVLVDAAERIQAAGRV